MTWLKVVDHYVGQFRFARVILQALLVGAFVALIWLGHRWYARSYTQDAHRMLAQAIELFDKADKNGSATTWDEVDRAFGQGYERFTGSWLVSTDLAPYFLAYQAEVALRKGDAQQAQKLLTQAVALMAKAAPLYTMYAVKLAQLQLNSGSEQEIAQGQALLNELAAQKKNPDRDMAVYYQGLYIFEKGDRKAAEQVWAPLLQSMNKANSLWAQLAQAKLDYTA